MLQNPSVYTVYAAFLEFTLLKYTAELSGLVYDEISAKSLYLQGIWVLIPVGK